LKTRYLPTFKGGIAKEFHCERNPIEENLLCLNRNMGNRRKEGEESRKLPLREEPKKRTLVDFGEMRGTISEDLQRGTQSVLGGEERECCERAT